MTVNIRNDFSKGQIARPAIGISKKPSKTTRTDLHVHVMERAESIRPPRKVEKIDPVMISLYIKDNPNRTIRDLAAQMSYECNYIFEDLLNFLSNRTLGYNTMVRHRDGGIEYVMVEWMPGNDETYYKKYLKIIEKKSAKKTM